MIVLPLLLACSDFSLSEKKDAPEIGDRVLSVEPALLDFGEVADNTPVTGVVTLTSTGDLPVTVASITPPDAPFALTLPEGDLVLDPGESTELLVTWTPTTASDAGSLGVHSDAVVPDVAVALRGAGHYPALSVVPGSLTLVSSFGESVDGVVTAWNVGTADLVLTSTSLVGAAFSAAGEAPDGTVTLAPGASTDVTITYTPVDGEDASTGELWFATNTVPESAMVPITGQLGPVCIGLGEAWDRGLLRAHTSAYASTFQLENRSGDEDICIDNWYVWRSVDSQDLGAGDMDADFGDAYPYGSMTLSAGGDVYYPYGAVRDESWWCMEQTQYTQARKNYTFTGARVPEPLLTYMLDGDQDGVWRWMEDHPVMIGGRGTNYVEVGRGGGTAEITLQLTNMGSVAGAAELRETLPYGWSASGASPAEARTETAADGGTVLVFETSLDARVLTDVYDDTLYDTQTFTYTLAIPPCTGRQILTPMETRWRDADGALRAGTANPLVVNCL